MGEKPDSYDIVIGLFVIAAVASVLFWISLIMSAGDEAENVEGWRTVNLNGVTYQYPVRLTTRYVVPVDWPPELELKPGPLDCSSSGESTNLGNTLNRTMGNEKYCVTETAQEVKGSLYTTYSYSVVLDDQVIVLKFSLRYFMCEGYEPGPAAECAAERNVFNLDSLVSQIKSTVKIDYSP